MTYGKKNKVKNTDVTHFTQSTHMETEPVLFTLPQASQLTKSTQK